MEVPRSLDSAFFQTEYLATRDQYIKRRQADAGCS